MRRFRGVLRDLTLFVSSIGYGLEQFRGLIGNDFRQQGESADEAAAGAQDVTRQFGDDFLLSTVIGFNQGVLSSLDASDLALIGILGATGAFAVLTIDKLRELAAVPRWIAIALLACSGILSLAGYTYRFIGRQQPGYVPRPAIFVPEFTLDGSNALARAIRATVRQSEANLEILRRKRSVALAASVLLLMAAVVVTYARLAGAPGFVLSSYGTLAMWGSR
ncbi:MAG: hypothetical protein QOF71_3463 [Candidatus Eremiobacteraeota bacterium]|jgi:hypothetical protein|nr:hypothetical protein [Candidatus Eremiobacteraeota bacterium]